MDVQQFEQAILKMAFETDAKITTASVAYYLGIPSKKANLLLENLLETGVLELDSDDAGNLYYFVPNQGMAFPPSSPDPFPSTDESWERLEAAVDSAAQPQRHPISTARPLHDQRHFTASIDDDPPGDDPLFSPKRFSPHQGADGGFAHTSPDPASYHPHHDPSSPWPQSPPQPRHRPSRFDGLTDGIASRLGRPDARPDRCHNASMILENAASCEPKPLADARPVVTSCTDAPSASNFSTHQDYAGFGFATPHASTALTATTSSSELALNGDNHIDQPEHQPGMALLLSLILCGTGQIYNGEVSKGIIMLILSFLLWFVFLGWVVHIWSIVDAVVVAERINRKTSNANAA